MANNNNYGLSGLGFITPNSGSFLALAPSVKSWRFRFSWADIETAEDVFDFTYMQQQFEYATQNNWPIWFSVTVGPIANTPAYLLTAPYNVPVVETTSGEYPYYLNSDFIARYDNMLAQVSLFLQSLPDNIKNNIVRWQASEGKTGDTDPYAGTITNAYIDGAPVGDASVYEILDEDWQNRKRDIWYNLNLNLAANLPGIQLLINPGNDLQNLAYVNNNYPNANIKTGDPTHSYGIPFEKYLTTYLQPFREGAGETKRIGGEFEQTLGLAWFQESYKQNLFALLCSALHQGIDIVNIAAGNSYTMLGNDGSAYEFFNKHAGIRSAADGLGFCAFRQVIDVNDATTYGIEYGVIIDPALTANFTAAIDNIIAQGYPAEQEQFYITNKTIEYLNPARIAALRAAYPDAAYHTISNDADQDAYNQDFGVDMIPGNYCRYLTQYDAEGTSKGYWRVGPTGGYLGRFARGFDVVNEKTAIFLIADTDLVSSNFYTVTIQVAVFDDGNNIWELRYFNGNAQAVAATMTNTNTGEWLIHSFTITDFYGGNQLTNGADIILTDASGHNTIFGFVELQVQQQNIPTNTVPDGAYKKRSDYFKNIANSSRVVAHNRPVSVGSTDLRKSFHRINDEDELNAACANWAHFPCVVHLDYSMRFKETGSFPGNRLVNDSLMFLAKIDMDAYANNLADGIEAAYNEAERAMNLYISFMENDYETNGSCGGLFYFDEGKITVSKIGPVNDNLFGWVLQMQDEAPAKELLYNDEDWY
ncbi:hypothetical protein [Limnovirga soli]|uniref:Uncharacterized protein n=1 Tax=Limnovirga soli TaxID=2656915 RepID=A0A8J8JW51_9BACT|nr:hypothetical protein [Limnovirga soli]NNV57364.1 hypothetical protein [Limnovirga soli]